MTRQLPASAIMVLLRIAKDGPHSPKELSKKLGMSLRTVSFALKRLLKLGVCHKVPNFEDMRKTLYSFDRKRAREIVARRGMDSVLGIQLSPFVRFIGSDI